MEIPEKYKPEINKLYDEIERLQSESKKAFDNKDVTNFIKLDDEIIKLDDEIKELRKIYTREAMGW